MAGKGRAVVEMPEDANEFLLSIPVGAVFTPATEKQSYVWVIDESSGTVSRRRVTVGGLMRTGVTVTEGLQAGELIATAGVHSLQEGQKVKVLQDRE